MCAYVCVSLLFNENLLVGAADLRSVLADPLRFSRVFPHRFEQQASISLLHLEAQLPQCRVVGRATAFQCGDQLLVQRVVFKEVSDGKDGPLADNYGRPVEENNERETHCGPFLCLRFLGVCLAA